MTTADGCLAALHRAGWSSSMVMSIVPAQGMWACAIAEISATRPWKPGQE